MKSLPWFRLYTEMIDDEKLGLLAFEDRWHFVALLCLKGKGVLDTEPDLEMLQRKVALKMGLTCAELEKVAKRLSRMKLIDFETFQPTAWSDRQMQSDSSSERVKAYRERMKEGPKQDLEQAKRDGNVSVTAQELDTDKEKKGANAPVSRTSLPTCQTQFVVDLFHKVLPELPAVRVLSDSRKKAIAGFWRFVLTTKRSDGTARATDAASALVWVRGYFERTRENDFLMGRGLKASGHENWTCDIDFLLSDRGKKHVIEKTKDPA